MFSLHKLKNGESKAQVSFCLVIFKTLDVGIIPL